MEAVRVAVGDDVDIGVDVHATSFQPSEAIALCRALEPYHPLFVEEPLRPESFEALAEVRAHVDAPIATGEMLYTKFEFAKLINARAVDIIQPDITIVGGIMEQKKISAIAEAGFVTVAPHNPCGPVATAVNVHYAATTPNFLILEYHPDDTPSRSDLVDEPVKLVDGYLELPERPGLGIELNEDLFERSGGVNWRRSPAWRTDGGLAFL
jgi:galactonate dehydratase